MHQFGAAKFTLVPVIALLLALVANVANFGFLVQSASAKSALYTPLNGSFVAVSDGTQITGTHPANDPLTVSIVLRPGNATQLTNMLTALYNPSSSQYHHWLAAGQFNTLFAPSKVEVTLVQTFLQGVGLQIDASPSPFLVQATGSTALIETAFHTIIDDYTSATGQKFYQNNGPVQIPTSLSNFVFGVTGLSSAVREHPNYITTQAAARSQGKAVPNYGAGPGGSGLIPSQTASLYDAAGVYGLGPQGQGAGSTLAVFELSGYTRSDISKYEHQFFGSAENVDLEDINVAGGPITPDCPPGDKCNSKDYSGDVEVEADLEMQIAIAPKVNRILVYNAPADSTGITELAEYVKIAEDDQADAVSSSWGECEQDLSVAYLQVESLAFEQMAMQGQSVFAASGDSGAYGCLPTSGKTNLAVLDPSSQPYVTAAGGTSFEAFDPRTNLHPAYPQGDETVWNVLNACNGTTGLAGCLTFGAGGGGVSTVWGRLSYQNGPGVISSLSRQAPYCSQAARGEYCRQTPDVSANADPYTPYAEYCTGNAKTNSTCAIFSSQLPSVGWLGIGGTSLSSPLWSGIIALWDSVHAGRFGMATAALYALYQSSGAYTSYFHDVTGVYQTENSNGYYPTTPNYDMATGIGTPQISNIATANF